MEKSIVNELVSQIHQLGKEDIPKVELLNILKNYVEKERKLMEIVFTDGNESYNGAYFDYYYNLKFGDKPLHALPDLNEAVFVKFKNRRGIITQYYGCFRKDIKGLYFETIYKDQFFNIVNIIQWNYADEKFVSNFNNIVTGLKIFDFKNQSLNSRFISIYEKYINIGLRNINNEKLFIKGEFIVETELEIFKYLYINPCKQSTEDYKVWMYNGILYKDYQFNYLYNHFEPICKLAWSEFCAKFDESFITEEDVIRLEENFDKHYNKSHVSIFKIK